MPCWQINRLVYETIKVKPETMAKALTGIKKELGNAFSVTVTGNALSITGGLRGQNYSLDLKTGVAAFQADQKHIHNLVKRQYSLATIQTLAGKSSVFNRFKLNKVSETKLTLTRR